MLDEKKRKTIVIGHKNPDTDSICSAICYAKMKQKLTGMEYEPCRAGHVNAETQFVLDYFGIEPPRLVENVKTQVKDIEIRRTQGVDRNISLKKAWNLMQDEIYLEDQKCYLDRVMTNDKENKMILCIMKDITKERKHKDQIYHAQVEAARMADKLVEEQLKIVQQIAGLLGETAADTKVAVEKLKNTILLESEEPNEKK